MIDRCPRCRYPLDGLPEQHNCPECGLPCDREADVFQESRAAVMVGIFAPLGMLPGLVLRMNWTSPGWAEAFLLLCPSAVLAGWIYRIRMPRNFLMLDRSGLTIVSGTEVHAHPWASIASVEPGHLHRPARIRTLDGRWVSVEQVNFAWSTRWKRFVTCARHWHARMAADRGDSPTAGVDRSAPQRKEQP